MLLRLPIAPSVGKLADEAASSNLTGKVIVSLPDG